jgi:uncharacterized protein (DUF305 family)
MAICIRLASAACVLLSATIAPCQDTPGAAPIIQPGAPGHAGKILSPSAAATAPRGPAEADTSFMQGMIMHHSQAVEMTDLMPARTRNKELLALGKRISISQTDEIKSMKQWLQDRGKPLEMPMDHSHMDHSAMKGMNMGSMHMMPGMLTPEQMKALAKASGKNFDRLFLTGMIQHHTGALIMVEDLFNTPGAGQDNVLFDFATDVDNTQRAEIEIMKRMLKEIR